LIFLALFDGDYFYKYLKTHVLCYRFNPKSYITSYSLIAGFISVHNFSSYLIPGPKEIQYEKCRRKHTNIFKDKFPLLEIDTELTKVMPPDEVLELVNACVSLSGYSRNDLRNAFFRALSISALDVYVDADQRCKVAIDIIVNGLENRFPDKTKLEYEWKGESSNLSELRLLTNTEMVSLLNIVSLGLQTLN